MSWLILGDGVRGLRRTPWAAALLLAAAVLLACASLFAGPPGARSHVVLDPFSR